MSKSTKQQADNESAKDEKFPLAPHYPKKEDIYNQEQKNELNVDEDTGKLQPNKKPKSPSMGLDVPGSEEDDANEIIGEEDEENNYYSLGGDNHENLEEDKGD